ncbi:MAG: S4 domain-containing protein [Flavobacteriales bacterium]|nr:S4 domain-containing protein [Flavobacteriales bacterium]
MPEKKKRYNGIKKKQVSASTFKRNNKNKGANDGLIRLNKHIAHSGICSRREADKFIEAGVVSVNGKVVTQMGYKVKKDDVVKFNNSTIKNQKTRYLLLNKPKNYVSRFNDPFKKNSIMRLIEGKCKETVSPIGKLDKTTTGLILFTNDNDLIKKLSKKTQRIKSIYQIHLNKNLNNTDLKKIKEMPFPNDFKLKINDISYTNMKDKKEVGVEIQAPTNNAIKNLFEKFGYKVTKADRVFYGGLTKKNLGRKESRFLTEEEVSILKRQ